MNVRKSIQASPAEIIASCDIIIGILIRLPLKKTIQYQLVSKQWCSFIKSPGFDRSRDLHQIPTTIRNFVSCIDIASIRYVDFFPIVANEQIETTPQRKTLTLSNDPHGTRILHSCHGILFCSNFRINENSWKYYVCNPVTNKFYVIPELGGVNEILGVSLAFDPSKSPHYRVVCVERLDCVSTTQNVFQIYIYCSKSSVWRKSGEPFNKYINYKEGVYWSGVYWNGAVHWFDKFGSRIVCYNIDEHIFKDIPSVPTIISRHRDIYYLGESRCGRLNLFHITPPNYMFDIYQLRKDGSAWYIKHRIYLRHMIEAYANIWPDTHTFLRILVVAHGETNADMFLVLGTPGKVVRCNINSYSLY